MEIRQPKAFPVKGIVAVHSVQQVTGIGPPVKVQVARNKWLVHGAGYGHHIVKLTGNGWRLLRENHRHKVLRPLLHGIYPQVELLLPGKSHCALGDPAFGTVPLQGKALQLEA